MSNQLASDRLAHAKDREILSKMFPQSEYFYSMVRPKATKRRVCLRCRKANAEYGYYLCGSCHKAR